MAYTEEELAGLTDEEREALLEEDGQDGGGADDGADEGTDTDHDEGAGDGEDGADSDDQDDAGAAADEGSDADGNGGDDAGDEEGEAQAPAAHAPILVAEAPEKAQERLQEIAGEKKALRKQYDEGELTFEDYESAAEKLDDERMDIKLALNTAETAQKIAQQQEINAREAEINGFLAEVEIPRDPNNEQFRFLDNAVRAVAALPDSAEKSAREVLQEAYDLCVFKKQLPARGEQRQEQRQEPAKPAAKPAVQRKPAPPTLAKVPAADMTGTADGSKFAYLDRLDPVAREAAFAKLSPADQDAYLQQA